MIGLLFSLLISSASAQQAMIDQARELQLARHPGWLRLIHFRQQGLTQHYKGEVDGPNFYIGSRTSPEQELEATLSAFNRPETQCQYLARRRFLQKHLNWTLPWAECQDREDWLNKLNAQSVSIIFATSYMNNPASMFGHTFLKFHTQGNPADKDLLNYGVNFAANTGPDGGLQFMWRGLFGGYRGGFTMLPYHHQLREYTHLDGRDIWEYKLNFSELEVRYLVEHLLELEQTYFDYYFLDENCSYQLLSLLEVVRPEKPLTTDTGFVVIPADTIATLNKSGGWIAQRSYRPSLQSTFNWTSHGLSAEERSWMRELTLKPVQDVVENWPALKPERKALILDSALVYAALGEIKAPGQWTSRNYQMKVARAQLATPTNLDPIQPQSGPPEQGHGSSQLALHFGTLDTRFFWEIQARAAYHHLLSQSAGHLRNSHMELAKLRLRFDDKNRIYLQEITALDILSAPPATAFSSPTSWKVNARAERFLDSGNGATLDPSLEGGLGYTFSLTSKIDVLGLANAHLQYGEDLSYQTRVGGSPQIALLSHASDSWRTWLSYQYRWYWTADKAQFPVFEFAQSYNPNRDFELRLGTTLINQHTEWKGQALWHF